MTKRTKTKSARGAVNRAVGKLATVSPRAVAAPTPGPRAARTGAHKRARCRPARIARRELCCGHCGRGGVCAVAAVRLAAQVRHGGW